MILKIIDNCGIHERTIFRINDKVYIGCSVFTQQKAIEAIKIKYKKETAYYRNNYLDKVNSLFIDNDGYVGDIFKQNINVRFEVAKLGKLLEQLKDDKNSYVRYEVVKHGKFLEQLKDDVDWRVRYKVAEQGKFLEQFKDDKDYRVRNEVAKQLKKK